MSSTFYRRLTAAVVAVLFVFSLLLAIGLTPSSKGIEQRVTVSFKGPREPISVKGSVPAATTGQLSVRTTLANLTAAQNLRLIEWRVPGVIATFIVVLLTSSVALRIAGGRPFDDINIWSLRAAGGALALFPFLKLLTDRAKRSLIEHSDFAGNAVAGVGISWAPLMAAAALLLVSEAFAAGRRAEKNAEGLI